MAACGVLAAGWCACWPNMEEKMSSKSCWL
jgi:hypothetical protein